MAELGQAYSPHIAATALETMGRIDDLRGVARLVQQAQTLFGVSKKRIQQQRILSLHDFLQRTQHVVIQMCLSHLFAP
ncbi:hypothetical protein D3C80_1845150 [compost metagenome]